MTAVRIVFATFGSLGDLHPYIAIARELARRGHHPVIASFDIFREPVEAAGAEFAAMRPEAARLGDHTAVVKRLMDPWRGPEYLVREMFMPQVRESYEDLERAAAGADVLVTHPLAFAGPLLAEKRGLRWASSVLAPLSLFSAMDPPLFPAAPWLRYVRRLGVAPYRLVFRIPRRMMRAWETPLTRLRSDLGLPATPRVAQMEGQYAPALNLALFSGVLAAPQADWPPNTVVCGFPRYDGPAPDAVTRAALESFLDAGEPPVVFALGSSVVMIADDFWPRAVETVCRLGRRAILLTGKPPEQLGALPPTVAAFPYLPYSLVFPRAAAVVHSCGIGTLAQALAAGRPQLIVPAAFDQPDNARRTVSLGVARSIPFRKATASAMAPELATLFEMPAYAARAADIGALVRSEDGARAACDAILR
jgi:UDP:flavonoid glycosyltransferase YjiC (YdhE family)